MEPKKKKLIPVIAVIIVWAIIISGGYYFYTQYTAANDLYQQKIHFRFFNDVEKLDDFIDKSADEISSYKPKTDEFNHRIYYKNLTDNQRLVYNAYQYAFDNKLSYIYIENELLEGSDLDAADIYTIFTLDNTAIQQNIPFDNYTYDPTFVSSEDIFPVIKESEGVIIGSSLFSSERIGKMNKSIAKLKTIDFGFSSETTEYEKIVEIYKYVQENLVYEDLDENADNYGDVDFLYNAVFKGKTNCDGYATMFGILCELNGIKTFDKSFSVQEESENTDEKPSDKPEETDENKNDTTTEDEEKEEGHTWNVVSVDGKWYNVDSTESSDEEDNDSEFFLNTAVCFEDKLQDSDVDYGDLAPKCEDNLIPFIDYYKSFDADGITNALCDAMKNADNSIIVFAVKNYKDGDENTVLQNLCNRLYIDISFYTTETKDYTLFYVKER